MKHDYKNVTVPDVPKIGVYAIHNKSTDRYYIGSSVNVRDRMKLHRRNLFYYAGINNKMRNDIQTEKDLYNFEFLVLEVYDDNQITDEFLREREYQNILKYNSFENGYNTYYPIASYKFNGVDKIKTSGNNERVTFLLPNGYKELLKNQYKNLGYDSMNSYINFLVDQKLEELERAAEESKMFMNPPVEDQADKQEEKPFPEC